MRLRACLLLAALVASTITLSELSGAANVVPGLSLSGGGQFCPGGISWRVAESHIGQRRSVEGTVKSTFFARRSDGRPTFLDLGRPFSNAQRFTVVIWGRNDRRFDTPPGTPVWMGARLCHGPHTPLQGASPDIR